MGLFIAVTVLNQLLLKWAADAGASTAQALFVRGSVCAMIAFLLGLIKGDKLTPSRLTKQALRFLNAGFALTAIMGSYRYLSATSVSLIARMDLPITLVFATHFGAKENRIQRTLALIAIIITVIAVLSGEAEQRALGLGLGFCGVGAIAIGYLFLRSATRTESAVVVAATPGLACAAFGVALILFTRETAIWSPAVTTALFVTGAAMYSLYRLTAILYQRLSIVDAEYPTIAVPLLSMPLEYAILGRRFTVTYIALTLVIVALLVIALVSRRESNEQRKSNQAA